MLKMITNKLKILIKISAYLFAKKILNKIFKHRIY